MRIVITEVWQLQHGSRQFSWWTQSLTARDITCAQWILSQPDWLYNDETAEIRIFPGAGTGADHDLMDLQAKFEKIKIIKYTRLKFDLDRLKNFSFYESF